MKQRPPPPVLRKMLRFFRARRSGGVRIGWRIDRLIRRADAARDRSEWHKAAQLYRRIVDLSPHLVNMHVQYGHALKESGHIRASYEAYRQATALAPNERDPRLHLGHAAKLIGAHRAASEAYLALLIGDHADAEAAAELLRSLGSVNRATRDGLLERLRMTLPEELIAALTPHADGSGQVLAFDLSDLIDFFSHARRPTGIQRVQIEVVSAAIAAAPTMAMDVVLCCMPRSIDEWCEVPVPLFKALVQASLSDKDTDAWRLACSRTNIALLLGRSFHFGTGSCLVNLGASWALGNYFLALRNEQARSGLAYIPFFHDLIPVVHPEFHAPELIQTFRAWLQGALANADHFLTNSLATKSDLLSVARGWGAPRRSDQVTVVRLDAQPQVATRSGVLNLVLDEQFILFVGTIEPRKGHLIAFDAWSALLRDGGDVPHLVCVSGKGWRNDAVLGRLNRDVRLAERITILSDVGDGMLDQLYHRAAFTIYPSLYEGWGLPVTEALARGKIVVTTRSSSLPEAGGSLALYVEPGDACGLADTVRRLIADPNGRAALEQRIAREFQSRSWADIAGQIIDVASTVARAPRLAVAPRLTTTGLFYRLGRWADSQVAGEPMRIGDGWFWPQPWGNRVRAEGGTLRFVFEHDFGKDDRLVLALLLRGTNSSGCRFHITVDNGAPRVGQLSARQRRWVLARITAGVAEPVNVTIAGKEDPTCHPGGDTSSDDGSTVGVEGWVTMPISGLADGHSMLRDILRTV